MKSRSKSSPESLVISSASVKESVWGDNSHLVLECNVKTRNFKTIPSLALIDTGASAHGFIDTKFVRNHDLKIIPLSQPRSLKVFDGTDSASGLITHLAQTTLDIGGHSEPILLFVTSLAYFDIVLGLPWLQYHDPDIQWSKGLISFKNQKCKKHSSCFPTTVISVSPDQFQYRKENNLKPKKSVSQNHDEKVDNNSFEDLAYDESVKCMKI